MKLRLAVGEPYNLDLSMQPSFVSSMYVRSRPGLWVKVAGTLGGLLKLRQEKPNLITATYEGGGYRNLEELIMLEMGLWHRPFKELINNSHLGMC